MPTKGPIHRMLMRAARLAIRGVLLLAGLAGAYYLAGTAGSMIPVNRAWQQPTKGVRIYVVDNGIHTDLVLPIAVENVDWRDIVRPEHLRDPRQAARSHVVFGWGDRDFYLNTPSWRDVNPVRVAKAMVGLGATVLHVSHADEPATGPEVRAVTLRPDEYRRLAAFIRATFANGTVVPGYGDYDAFYPANGGYSAIRTCNAWTSEALRTAGVRTGAWTPFSSGVMRWY